MLRGGGAQQEPWQTSKPTAEPCHRTHVKKMPLAATRRDRRNIREGTLVRGPMTLTVQARDTMAWPNAMEKWGCTKDTVWGPPAALDVGGDITGVGAKRSQNSFSVSGLSNRVDGGIIRWNRIVCPNWLREVHTTVSMQNQVQVPTHRSSDELLGGAQVGGAGSLHFYHSVNVQVLANKACSLHAHLGLRLSPSKKQNKTGKKKKNLVLFCFVPISC